MTAAMLYTIFGTGGPRNLGDGGNPTHQNHHTFRRYARQEGHPQSLPDVTLRGSLVGMLELAIIATVLGLVLLAWLERKKSKRGPP
jgi:hypothetical protein